MHRLLVPSEQLASDSPVLPKEAANHLKVLRPKDGEEGVSQNLKEGN